MNEISDSDWYRTELARYGMNLDIGKDEEFTERVGIMCANGIDEETARMAAFNGGVNNSNGRYLYRITGNNLDL